MPLCLSSCLCEPFSTISPPCITQITSETVCREGSWSGKNRRVTTLRTGLRRRPHHSSRTCRLNRAQAVGNHQRGAALGQTVQRFLHQMLRLGVERAAEGRSLRGERRTAAPRASAAASLPPTSWPRRGSAARGSSAAPEQWQCAAAGRQTRSCRARPGSCRSLGRARTWLVAASR